MKARSKKLILAIETSCDETAAAVLSLEEEPYRLLPPTTRFARSLFPTKLSRPRSKFDGLNATILQFPKIKTLSSVIKSQIQIHSKFGGVVPEAAARAHVKNILPVTEKALSTVHCPLSTVDYIAVTQGPGLAPSLIVGVEFAKALSLATGKPIIPVNHLLGHLYSPLNEVKDKGLKIRALFPMISLIVSGGHTMLVLMSDVKNYRIIGQTVDDAAGEAFDKVAKLLDLPYPGGPEVSKLAASGDPNAINFPRPMINSKNYNFSFSGLKTAVLYYIRDHVGADTIRPLQADVCASFQQAAIDVLASKTRRAAKEFKAKSISISGGVSANVSLREKLKVESKKLRVKFFVPPVNLSTDNAEMIGLAAGFMLRNGYRPKSFRQIKADPNLSL
jgi:N6-L-threonylcarbamoyladenine synthase